jgi:hypothetical protein
MTKRDRIAIVATVIYSAVIILATVATQKEAILFLFLILPYWGYRFIQDDISFIGKKDSK